jgi:hypothetical protein
MGADMTLMATTRPTSPDGALLLAGCASLIAAIVVHHWRGVFLGVAVLCGLAGMRAEISRALSRRRFQIVFASAIATVIIELGHHVLPPHGPASLTATTINLACIVVTMVGAAPWLLSR